MKIFFIVFLFLITTLVARENPFKVVYETPPNAEDIIPLLNIKTNPVFGNETNTTEDTSITKETNSTVVTAPIEKVTTVGSKKEIQKTKKIEKKKKHIKKRYFAFKTIYQNYFLKVQTNYKHIKVITKDKLLRKTRFINPSRLAFDFKRLQYFRTKHVRFNKAFAKRIKFGSHHEFYRMTVELNHYKRFKIAKKPYGYLITLY